MNTATTHTRLAAPVPLLGSQGWIRPPAPDDAGGLIGLLREWLQRSRMREQISELDEHLLKDIGLTPADVRFEAGKHFWQA